MIGTWKELATGLGVVLLALLSHRFEPQATDVFLVICLVIALWHVLGWKLMSRKRRAKVIAGFKVKKGIPPDQPHKVDSLLKG